MIGFLKIYYTINISRKHVGSAPHHMHFKDSLRVHGVKVDESISIIFMKFGLFHNIP